MYLIVGLGNPDLKYAGTRHNIGFEAAVYLHDMLHFSPERGKFQALISQGEIEGEPCILCRPMTYMNQSGIAVQAVAGFYKIPADQIIIMYDDIALPVGHLRLRKGGSAGGHNGMKSIIAHLGTQEFPRVRMGVGEKPQGWDLADYVLGRFTAEEIPVMQTCAQEAAKAAQAIVARGMDKAMNLYNTKRA